MTTAMTAMRTTTILQWTSSLKKQLPFTCLYILRKKILMLLHLQQQRVSVLVSSSFPNYYLYRHSADTVEKIENARLCVCASYIHIHIRTHPLYALSQKS